MKLLLYAGNSMSNNFSFIAPMRIARICAKNGIDVKFIEWANPLVPHNLINFIDKEFEYGITGSSVHVDNMVELFNKTIQGWKPDVVFNMGYTHGFAIKDICKERGVPYGVLIGDPFYSSYPEEGSSLVSLLSTCDFIAFNEGQALNYIKAIRPKLDNLYLLNHAIDLDLRPTYEQVVKGDKKYICSIVGGDDRIRRRELLNYFYQWTDCFPTHSFAVGGSHSKGANEPYTHNDLSPNYYENQNNKWNKTEFTMDEVEKYSGKVFNLTFIPNDLDYPLGLSHKAVHKLYSESVFGFTPYGKYLVDGRVSAYTGMTFGTKIFEMSGSAAVPISNRIKDIEHVIKHGETGFILEKPEDGHKVFKWAIDNPKDAKEMGLRAYLDTEKRNSWQNRYDEVLLPIFKKVGVI